MCGIIGFCKLDHSENLGTMIKKALKRLEYRGYDSVGFAVIDYSGDIIIKKKKGKINQVASELEFDSYDGSVGFGHTRWATHGEPNDINAHPHTDCTGCIAIVHNGIIQNYQELKKFIYRNKHTVRSDTDTEIIVHLIEHYIKQKYDVLDALRKVVSIIKGTYAFLIISCNEPDKIYFAKNISPLIIGIGDNIKAIASDIPALVDTCKFYINIHDGELGYISKDDIYIEKFNGEIVNYSSRVQIINIDPQNVDKGGFPHFMLKEIFEQPLAIRSSLAGIKDQLINIIPILSKAENIYIFGAGTSYHAALALEYSLMNYAEINTRAIVSSEYKKYLDIVNEGDVAIAYSQSGETIDTILALRSVKSLGVKTIAITNTIGSTLDREADYRIYTRAGPEIGVAATKTFTSQIAVGMYLTAEIAKYFNTHNTRAERILDELKNLPDYIASILDTSTGATKSQALILKESRSMYFLGRGSTLSVSMEGALKVKEISYIHAESYPAGESKHGPIALIDKGFPVFFTVFNDEYKEVILGNIEEMKARGAYITVVAPENYSEGFKLANRSYKMPILNTPVASAAYIVIYQLLSYYLALAKGYDPDKPRNLAKTVTVE